MNDINKQLYSLRMDLDLAFSEDTAVNGTLFTVPSAGHCAAVSVIVYILFSGDMLSTIIDGTSHWFNRVPANVELDVDLTGDQFGFPPVQITKAGKLYSESKIRTLKQVNDETLKRAHLLATRANMMETPIAIAKLLKYRVVDV